MDDDATAPDQIRPRLLFIGGLHRSGTTLLADVLADHPSVSGLTDTGVPHDEGQHLQSVYATARDSGGPGRFAHGDGAHLTEADVVDAAAEREQLMQAWSPFWDMTRSVLVEKSPPNLLRFRYLQTIFPDAAFVAVVRHPVAVAYATQPWSQTSLASLLEHWLHAHETFERDRPLVRNLLFLRYEDFVADVPAGLAQLDAFLGLAPHTTATEVRANTNDRYLKRWGHTRVLPSGLRAAGYGLRYERRLQALGYGYSLRQMAT